MIGPDGECAVCRARRQRLRSGVAARPVAPPVVTGSAGVPVERASGPDFSGIRVHADAAAARPARVVNATTVTVARLSDGQLGPETSTPPIERDYQPDWSLFLRPMSAPAVQEKCKEFPGGSTDCEVNESTGIPTGRVVPKINETNPCTRPCVEKHEAVHVKQLTKLCAALRDCYVAADKGKRPASDCFKMATQSGAKNECEAYTVSVPCVEQRLKTAPECKTAENQRYGADKLTSEKCFRDAACGAGKKIN